MFLRCLSFVALASCGPLAMAGHGDNKLGFASATHPSGYPWPVQGYDTSDEDSNGGSDLDAMSPEDALQESFDQFMSSPVRLALSPFFPFTNTSGSPVTFTLVDCFENAGSEVFVYSFSSVGCLSLRGARSFSLEPGEPAILAVRALPGTPLSAKVFSLAQGNGSGVNLLISFNKPFGVAPTGIWVPPVTSKALVHRILGKSAPGLRQRSMKLRGDARWAEVRGLSANPEPCATGSGLGAIPSLSELEADRDPVADFHQGAPQ